MDGRLRADLKLYMPSDPDDITIGGREVPLEIEPTAISDTKVLLTLFGGQPVYGSLALERP